MTQFTVQKFLDWKKQPLHIYILFVPKKNTPQSFEIKQKLVFTIL